MNKKSIFQILDKHFVSGSNERGKDVADDENVKGYLKKERRKHNLRLLVVFMISLVILSIIYLILL